MEKALLVSIDFFGKDSWPVNDIQDELAELTRTTGAKVAQEIICTLKKLTPDLLIGSGKAQEIALLCREKAINVVIFSADLSGTQQRNLEEIVGVKTIDRTQLILDIFARQAKSQEGKVQVGLAQLEYLLPRLVGKGIMLSRLGGGIGTRGPGEQKLEVDRRRIKKTISRLKNELAALRKRRQALREKRKSRDLATVALIGYTNAGKSTLLNSLTQASQVVQDKLFTTLDPLTRRLTLPNNQTVLLTDTVGFLHNLPHHLIEAFKATLEEVNEADLLLHVLDISHPLAYEHNLAVYEVLEQIGVKEKIVLTVLNKIDKLLDKEMAEGLTCGYKDSVAVSALKKENLDKLTEKIYSLLLYQVASVDLLIPHSQMRLVNLIYQQGKVIDSKYSDKGVEIKAQIPLALKRKLSAFFACPPSLKCFRL